MTKTNHKINTVKSIEKYREASPIEFEIIDDTHPIAVGDCKRGIHEAVVVLDLETTGLSAVYDEITEIGAVKVVDGKMVDRYATLVNPKRKIPKAVVELTGITDDMVRNAPVIETVLPELLDFCKDSTVVTHNTHFDISFLKEKMLRLGYVFENTYIDTVLMAKLLLPGLKTYALDKLAAVLEIPLSNHHRAVDDAEATMEIYRYLLQILEKKGVRVWEEVNELLADDWDVKWRLRTHQASILPVNETGRKNFREMIEKSARNEKDGKYRIPKSILQQHREGVIIGSGSNLGELYRAVMEGKREEDIERIVDFYDYLEIPSVDKSCNLITNPHFSRFKSVEDIMELNRQIVWWGRRKKKSVIETVWR